MAPPASHLYAGLRIHQVFASSTDVGKTVLTTALALASAALPVSAGPGSAIALTQDGKLTLSDEGERVHYVKPISTGPLRDSDSHHITRYLPKADAHTLFQFNDPVSPHVAVQRYAKETGKTLDTSDNAVLRALSKRLANFAAAQDRPAAAYIETAGGVHSPAPSGSSFSELLRPLRMPTILIGDSNLGGISTTKSAYDSLLLAGYDIDALLLFSDAGRGWGNAEYLTKWGKEVGLPVWALSGPRGADAWGVPPTRGSNDEDDCALMRRYYAGMVAGRGDAADADESAKGMAPVIEHLRQRHHARIEGLSTLASRTRETCWWPFTQHMLAKSDADVNVIDSAHGDFFTVLNQTTGEQKPSSSLLRPMLDGSASWWTQCLGHADAGLTRAAARAAGRYGHVLFPMCANEPALQLSETLIGKAPRNEGRSGQRMAGTAPGAGWASRVFFSDDGSTGMEVALKMAISSTSARYKPQARTESTKERALAGRVPGSVSGRAPREWMVLGLKGSYHGDTIGAMDACEPNVFNDRVDWYRGRGNWFEPPTVAVRDGRATVTLPLHDEDWQSLQGKADATRSYDSLHGVYDVASRLETDALRGTYTDLIHRWLDHLTRVEGNRYGALVLEPLVMGAGGMICVDPLFQRCFVDLVRGHPELFAQTDPPLRRPTHLKLDGDGEGAWRGLPIIFDEVFTGLYRLGFPTPARALGVDPDISVLAKILTGGMVPMSVTLASKSIFDTFAHSDQKADALLHGHSYTAHPIGCAVANETLRRIEQMRQGGEWDEAVRDWSGTTKVDATSSPAVGLWSFWSREAVQTLSRNAGVESAMALGTVLILNLRDLSGKGGYSSSAAVDLLQHLRTTADAGGEHDLAFNIHARPLGNVVYIMCSLNTPVDVRRKTEEALSRALQ